MPKISSRKFDLLVLVALPLIIRLAMIGSFELVEDEAYYWQWSQHLDYSYHDQGPGVALAIRAGTELFGNTEFGVRFFAPILFALGSLFAYLLMIEMFGPKAGRLALILVNICPLFSFGAMLAMHESVQGFFWATGLYLFWKAVNSGEGTGPASGLLFWLAAGLCVGFGFDGKYTAILFMPAALFFIVSEHKDRQWLKRPHPYLAALAAFAAVTPVLYWNHNLGWQSLKQIAALGNRPSGWPINPANFFELVGSQIGIVSPIIYGFMIYALVKAYKTGIKGTDRPARFLFAFSVFYFGPFYLYSFRSFIYANWPGLGYYAGLLLTAGWIATSMPDSDKMKKWWNAGLYLAGASTLLIYVLLPFATTPFAPAKRDPLNRIYGWKQLGTEVSAVAKNLQATEGDLHIYARSYQIASELAFYMPNQPTVFEVKGEARPNHYDYWPDLPTGSNALFVMETKRRVPSITKKSFSQIEAVKEIVIKRGSQVAKSYTAYLCHNYTPQFIH